MTESTILTPAKQPRRWSFWRATLVILGIMVAGQVVGTLFESFGPAHPAGRKLSVGDILLGLPAKDWILVAFVLSLFAFLWLQRASVLHFFRSMQVGVVLVALTLLAVITGVLVPQIEGFEDPSERVPSIRDVPDATFEAYLACPPESPSLQPAERAQIERAVSGLDADQRARLQKYRDEYLKFRWAEGYFLYHLIHPYGIGMPSAALPPTALASLKHFSEKYGKEEGENRLKTMKAAFSGGAVSTEIYGLMQRNENALRRMFNVCTVLNLNRTYKSWWFATLLTLLFAGVAMNLFRYDLPTLFTSRKIGFAVVHVGVMTLLAGGAYSKWKTDRGILNLDTREGPKDVYFGYMNPDKPRQMPFAIKADRFARRDFKTIEVGFNDVKFSSMLPEYTIWPGFEKELDYAPNAQGEMRPGLRLRVLAVSERAHVAPPTFVEAGRAPSPAGPVDGNGGDGGDGADPYTIGPMATLTVSAAGEHDVQLAPRFPTRKYLYDPEWHFRLATSFAEDVETVKRSLHDVEDGHIGWLTMRAVAQGDAMPTRVPIKVGDKIHGPGGYEIEVLRATADFRLDHDTRKEVTDARPLEKQFPANPAVRVRIRAADGKVEDDRPVLERIDAEESGLQANFVCRDLVLDLEWDRWGSPGPDRYALMWDASGTAKLVSPRGETVTAAVGQALALPGPTRATLNQVFSNAHFERQIALDAAAPVIEGPHFDSTFYSTDPTGVQVEVTLHPGAADEHKEVIAMASTDEGLANLWMSPDKRFWLRYFHNDKAFPFEWRSVLSVWGKDANGKFVPRDAGPEWDREIRVNDYFYYKGYRFFQTNANAEFPTYSGIGVVYDPGIPFVLMGMYLTIVGAILAFLIRPLADRFGKSTPHITARVLESRSLLAESTNP